MIPDTSTAQRLADLEREKMALDLQIAELKAGFTPEMLEDERLDAERARRIKEARSTKSTARMGSIP